MVTNIRQAHARLMVCRLVAGQCHLAHQENPDADSTTRAARRDFWRQRSHFLRFAPATIYIPKTSRRPSCQCTADILPNDLAILSQDQTVHFAS